MSIKVVCQNRKAFHDYFIEERIEAGIVLVGTEVKSLRQGKAHLKDSYALIRDGEIFLLHTHISPYLQADRFTRPDPDRRRKLLLHKREVQKLIGKTKERGYTLIPTRIYFKNGKAKVELGLAKGKKVYDKREAIKKKVMEREAEKSLKGRKG
ncbi:MAG: SsrA-binding protein SmpB [Thermodesulfobacteriota bacterium]